MSKKVKHKVTKKSKLKFVIKRAMLGYYKSGMTNTAHNVYKQILQEINKL